MFMPSLNSRVLMKVLHYHPIPQTSTLILNLNLIPITLNLKCNLSFTALWCRHFPVPSPAVSSFS